MLNINCIILRFKMRLITCGCTSSSRYPPLHDSPPLAGLGSNNFQAAIFCWGFDFFPPWFGLHWNNLGWIHLIGHILLIYWWKLKINILFKLQFLTIFKRDNQLMLHFYYWPLASITVRPVGRERVQKSCLHSLIFIFVCLIVWLVSLRSQ